MYYISCQPLIGDLTINKFTFIIIKVVYGPVVQLVRMPACHAGGRGFEPLPGRHLKLEIES